MLRVCIAFCQVSVIVGKDKRISKAQSQSNPSAPVFNESFSFLVHQKREQDIFFQVQVMHKNTFTADIQIGSVTIDSSIIRVGRDIEENFEIRCEAEHGYPVCGGIRLKLRLETNVDNMQQNAPCSCSLQGQTKGIIF